MYTRYELISLSSGRKKKKRYKSPKTNYMASDISILYLQFAYYYTVIRVEMGEHDVRHFEASKIKLKKSND